jgi:hypothetical protein
LCYNGIAAGICDKIMNQVVDGDASCVKATEEGQFITAQSVIFVALSQILHMVLLAMADTSNVFALLR